MKKVGYCPYLQPGCLASGKHRVAAPQNVEVEYVSPFLAGRGGKNAQADAQMAPMATRAHNT